MREMGLTAIMCSCPFSASVQNSLQASQMMEVDRMTATKAVLYSSITCR